MPTPPSFESLYRSSFPYVFRSLARMGVHHAELEDLAQEVFLVVHRRMHTYDAERPLRPWLFGIVFNVVRDHRRRKTRRPEAIGLAPDTPHAGDAPDDDARLVRAALAMLSDEKRAVIVLCDLDGCSAADAAEALGLGVAAVSSRLRRARVELRCAVDALTRPAARAAGGGG